MCRVVAGGGGLCSRQVDDELPGHCSGTALAVWRGGRVSGRTFCRKSEFKKQKEKTYQRKCSVNRPHARKFDFRDCNWLAAECTCSRVSPENDKTQVCGEYGAPLPFFESSNWCVFESLFICLKELLKALLSVEANKMSWWWSVKYGNVDIRPFKPQHWKKRNYYRY